MAPPSCLLLDDAADAVKAVDPGLARKLRAQAYHMREWGYRTHEYDRLVDVAARVLPEHPGVPR
jgi:hypothetical protein